MTLSSCDTSEIISHERSIIIERVYSEEPHENALANNINRIDLL